MWPNSHEKDITELVSSEIEKLSDEDVDDDLRKRNDNTTKRLEAYTVNADCDVDEDLLLKAIEQVEWLVVSFHQQADNPPFPFWVFKLKNLLGLKLSCYPHTTLPEEIGSLRKLKYLNCYGSALTRLPRSIGQLKNLVELHCYCSYGLHYLPYEISKCSNLIDSTFSTRALFNNYKNKKPLPPLVPWWHNCAGLRMGRRLPTTTATPTSVSKLLSQILIEEESSQNLFPPSFSEQCILPFLKWDTCSVCRQTYQMELGFHAWSHQRIATDTHCLLAYCCSQQCASLIPNQLYFDARTKGNRKLPNTAIDTVEQMELSYDEEMIRWGKEHLENSYKPPKQILAMDDIPIMEMLSFSYGVYQQFYICLGSSSAQLMRVQATGDIRESPSSSSKIIGRLCVGRVVLVDSLVFRGERQWARLRAVCWNNENEYWTALRKKDGTLKLVEIYPTSCQD